MKKKRTLAEYRQVAGVDSNKHQKKKAEIITSVGEKLLEETFKNCDVPEAIKTIEESKWTEMECTNIKKFQFGEFPEIIYVIKTGFKNRYIVVQEDAYELHLGKSKLMTKEKVEKVYNIKLGEERLW